MATPTTTTTTTRGTAAHAESAVGDLVDVDVVRTALEEVDVRGVVRLEFTFVFSFVYDDDDVRSFVRSFTTTTMTTD